MKKIQIHGKDYVMVKDRIIFFNENFPNGSITTELKATENSFIFKSKITPDVEKPSRYFTGHAEEIIGSSQINKTSALENCETSAIGRALACMGIGIEDSFASADEVKNAQFQQEYSITDEQKTMYQELLHSGAYNGDKNKINSWWKELRTFQQAESGLAHMVKHVTKWELKQAEKKAKKESKSNENN